MSGTPEDVSFKLKEAIRLIEEAEAASARARNKAEAAMRALRLALEWHDENASREREERAAEINFTEGAEV